MNLQRIEAVLRLLQRQEHVRELCVEGDGWRLRARRGALGAWPLPEPEPKEEQPHEPPRHVVRAGLVGIYRAPEPPLQPGAFVARGASLGSIDSMRIPNPVTAEEPGRILEVLVEDGDPVEYGQELVILAAEVPT